jgi:hypothetical protein
LDAKGVAATVGQRDLGPRAQSHCAQEEGTGYMLRSVVLGRPRKPSRSIKHRRSSGDRLLEIFKVSRRVRGFSGWERWCGSASPRSDSPCRFAISPAVSRDVRGSR